MKIIALRRRIISSLSSRQGKHEEIETASNKVNELTEEELAQIAGGIEYIKIQNGETLSDIAQRYETTVNHLCALNCIANPDLIYPRHRIHVR